MTHADIRASGAMMMTGGCVVLSRSNKQKINMRSSTETELITIDDSLPSVQWTANFMNELGYPMETIIKEDSTSTMLLMKNRKLSSGKRTKHLDIRYFYVKDLMDRGIIKVDHCSPNDCSVFYKTTSRNKISFFKDMILNISKQHHLHSTLQYRSMLGNSYKGNIAVVEPVPAACT